MTTQRDLEIMEALQAAIERSEVRSATEWFLLCARLQATEAHRFAICMVRGGRFPWEKGEGTVP